MRRLRKWLSSSSTNRRSKEFRRVWVEQAGQYRYGSGFG